MQRREFISFLGGTIASWPLAARAQKPERTRLIGMLAAINDPEMKAFEQELEKRGWSEGRNIHIDRIGSQRNKTNARYPTLLIWINAPRLSPPQAKYRLY
jgi:hypothetical protein